MAFQVFVSHGGDEPMSHQGAVIHVRNRLGYGVGLSARRREAVSFSENFHICVGHRARSRMTCEHSNPGEETAVTMS